MYQLHTEKQQKYFREVIRLHNGEGYGDARIIPIGHTTAARWIAIFALEKGKIKGSRISPDGQQGCKKSYIILFQPFILYRTHVNDGV